MRRLRGVLTAMCVLLTACGPPAAPSLAPPDASTPVAALDSLPPPTRVPMPARATSVPTVAPRPMTAPTPRPLPPLQPALESVAAQHAGTIGLVVKALGPGQQTASLNPDRRFRSASLYKLFVMQLAAEQIDAGDLDPAEVLTLTPSVALDDPYTDLPVGTQTSVDCALQTMLQMSGNSAADLLIERLGLATINNHLARRGLSHTSITQQTAFTSPSDVARLLEDLASDAASPGGARMLEFLAGQQHADRLPAPLPLGVRVAHKTGELPRLRNDAGIVYAPSGAYVFVALVDEAPGEPAARDTIVDLSRAAYDALEPIGLTSAYGLPPRLARDAFSVPDARGRLELLGDSRSQSVRLADVGVRVDNPDIRLRSEVVPDLLALQTEADEAGLNFTALDGLRAPTDPQADQAQPLAWLAPCAMQLPGPGEGGRYGQQPAPPEAPPALAQQWLGTLAVVDAPADWLAAHAWQHGFVPAPPETAAGQALGYEPGALRWVGPDMAADVHRRGLSGPAVLTELARARAVLDAQAAPADERQVTRTGPDSLGTPCWAAPDTTGQGCPARWYFSPS